MTDARGGAERVLATVASGLADRGHDVSLLSFDRKGQESFFPFSRKIRRIELGIGPTVERSTWIDTLSRMFAMRKSIKQEAPDAVIGFMHSMYIPLGLSLLGTGIPVIASDHIVGKHYDTRPLEAMLLRLSPSITARMVCVSEQARQSFPASISAKMVAIANPVPETPIRANVIGQLSHRKILLSVARLDPQKDQEVLVDAFSEIANELPEWDLRMVGEGAMRAQLEERVARHKLENRIFLPGAVKEISKEYGSAQLFVLPSRYESFGLVIAEALSHGLPAVGFADCQGANILIQPGVNGQLAYPTGNRSSDLAATLRTLMTDSAMRQRLAEKAATPLEGHTLPKILDDWEAVIRSVKRNELNQPVLPAA